ncbi:MAG: hypothetical protein LC623_05185, partial [Halobacteriales archaeon]|nr:hypothetical protein [Halobacteriales archaeon]
MNPNKAAVALLFVSLALMAGCFDHIRFNGLNVYNLTPEKKSVHVTILDDTKTWLNTTVQV